MNNVRSFSAQSVGFLSLQGGSTEIKNVVLNCELLLVR